MFDCLCAAQRRYQRLNTVGAAAAAVWLIAAAGMAAAQTRAPDAQERSKAISIVVGAPASANCAAVAAMGRFDDDALAFCVRAIESERLNHQNRIVTRINRGALYLRRGAAAATPAEKLAAGQAALADFDLVVERLAPTNAEAHMNRGTALVMIGKFGQAVEAFTTALGLGLRAPQKAYLNRGAARESLGDIVGAYEDYRTALEIDPNWAAAEAELARFARAGRDRTADRLANRTTPKEDNGTP